MNTNAFITFNTLLLIVVYLLVYQFDPEYEENMAKFIPDNAIVYLEQRDVKAAIHTFQNSQLGRNFNSIDFTSSGEKIGVSKKIIDAIETIQNNYSQIFENDVLDELLGNRFALAVFWPEKEGNGYGLRSFIKENSVIIAEPKHRPELLQYIAEHYNKKIRDITFQTIQYGNHQISRITSPKGQISLSVIEGLLITSFNEKLLKRSIDAYDNEIPSIYNTNNFKSVQEEFDKPQRFLYFPVDTLKEVAYKFIDFFDPATQNIIEVQLDSIQGFSGISYGAWPTQGLVQDKIVFSYEANETNPVVRKHLKTKPSVNSMLELTTGDPLAYYWSNTVDVRHFLSYLPPEGKKENPVRNYIERLETLSHLTVEQILETLGEEVSFVVERSSVDNFFPVPRAAAFFRVDTKVDLSEIVNYIVDAFEVPVIEQVYNSVTYLYWVASPQDGLQPLCGFWSNLFFIGNSAQLIERVIDGYNENTSLLSNPKIRSVDPGITMENNSVTYFNNVEIIELSQRLLSALSTMILLEDRDKAGKARVIISEVINPLLNGLKEYDKSCTRSYFAPGMVVIDSRTSIASKTTAKEAK